MKCFEVQHTILIACTGNNRLINLRVREKENMVVQLEIGGRKRK